MTVVLFLIILGALVFVHELGHFLAAKKAGIRVDEFALGFPPKIIGKKYGETTYNLNLVPFGGYVKIFGEDGEENAEQTQTEANKTQTDDVDKTRRFTSKPRYIQAVVLASGVLGNIIFAWLLISTSFMTGIPSSVEGRYANQVQEPKLTITSVLADAPAGKAGLRGGDVIWSITEGETSDVMKNQLQGYEPEHAREFISSTKGPLTFQYERGGEMQEVTLTPEGGIVEGKRAIGVTLDAVGVVEFGLFRSFYEGTLMTWDLLREVTVGLFGFLKQAILGEASLEAITGPVGIAGLVGEARSLGLVYLLSFTAFISINLAVINLLPIPALDGGRLLFLAIEGITRRPIPVKFTRTVNTAGFVLLVAFMLFITYRDIVKLF